MHAPNMKLQEIHVFQFVRLLVDLNIDCTFFDFGYVSIRS
jgi:hypothetical protein